MNPGFEIHLRPVRTGRSSLSDRRRRKAGERPWEEPMPDLPDPQDKADQPDQATPAPADVEIYTTERLQEFLADNTMTPDLRARAEARLNREPRHD